MCARDPSERRGAARGDKRNSPAQSSPFNPAPRHARRNKSHALCWQLDVACNGPQTRARHMVLLVCSSAPLQQRWRVTRGDGARAAPPAATGSCQSMACSGPSAVRHHQGHYAKVVSTQLSIAVCTLSMVFTNRAPLWRNLADLLAGRPDCGGAPLRGTVRRRRLLGVRRAVAVCAQRVGSGVGTSGCQGCSAFFVGCGASARSGRGAASARTPSRSRSRPSPSPALRPPASRTPCSVASAASAWAGSTSSRTCGRASLSAR